MRKRIGWVAFFAALIFVGVNLAIVLPAIMRAAALSTSQHMVFGDYLAASLLAAVLFLLIIVAPLDERDKGRLLFLWVVKATLTLFFLPIYEAHYAALDARVYFSIGALGTAPLPVLNFGSGSSVMIWLLHGVTRVLPAYFHLLEMLWSFVGLAAIYAFYRGWRWLVPELDARFLLWVGLFPTILFWSSILGKDPIVLLGVGLYFYGVAKWSATHRSRLLVVAALGVLIATAIRPWFAIILVAPMVAFMLAGQQLRGWQKIILFSLVVGGAYFAVNLFLHRFDVADVKELVQTSNTISHNWAYGGSALQVAQFGSALSLVTFLPRGMFTALFRPLPGDVGNLFGLAAGAVNAFLLVLFAIAVWRTPARALRIGPLLWMVLLILIWAAMYAFPSSQNLGTASRFALQILPVLWPLLYLLSRRRPVLLRQPGVRVPSGRI